jgi:hypothetical protein
MPADEVPSYWAESPLKRVARPDGFRVGGRPYLLQEIQPPVCEHCGNVMAFIAQAPLTRPLKMSDSFDVAYAFMCDRLGKRICPSFKPFSGANALLLQRGGGKGRAGCDATAKYPEYGFRLRKHCEPLGGDPNIHVGDDFVELVFSGTKLGGVPAWAQGDETPACPACGKRMGLIAQVSSCIDWPEGLPRTVYFSPESSPYA